MYRNRHTYCAAKPSEDFAVLSQISHKLKSIGSAIATIATAVGGAVILALAPPALSASPSQHQSIVRGRQLYVRYCAACHGNDADGRGPVADDLKASPPDLRYLGARYGMPLPIGTIARFIDGRQDVAAHGPRDMPVWGRRFYEAWTAHEAGEEDIQTQIREIVEYLDAIQRMPHPSGSPHSPLTRR
jgi:mono/diheme cytochrome c family protein